MRQLSWILLLIVTVFCTCGFAQDEDFDEFADIDEFDDIQDVNTPPAPETNQNTETEQEIEPDDEVFDEDSEGVPQLEIPPPTTTENPKPSSNWTEGSGDFRYEVLALLGLIAYALNYIMGSRKNKDLAKNWAEKNWQIVEQEFELTRGENDGLIQESANEFVMMGVGRLPRCLKLLSFLNLIPRHDLAGMTINTFLPGKDTIETKLFNTGLPAFIMAICRPQLVKKVRKENPDVAFFCKSDHPGSAFNISDDFVVMTDCYDAAIRILRNPDVQRLLESCKEYLDFLHVSDQVYFENIRDESIIQSGELKEIPEPRQDHSSAFRYSPTMPESAINATVLLPLSILDQVNRLKLDSKITSKQKQQREKFQEPLARFLKQQKNQDKQALHEQKQFEKRQKAEKQGGKALEKYEARELRRKQKKMAKQIKIV